MKFIKKIPTPNTMSQSNSQNTTPFQSIFIDPHPFSKLLKLEEPIIPIQKRITKKCIFDKNLKLKDWRYVYKKKGRFVQLLPTIYMVRRRQGKIPAPTPNDVVFMDSSTQTNSDWFFRAVEERRAFDAEMGEWYDMDQKIADKVENVLRH
jgi:hypothetical protein